MKKKNILILILIFVVTIVGCKPTIGSKEVDTDNTSNPVLTISDYFPFKEDTVYDYEGIGNEFAEQKTYLEFIEGNRAQLKILNPATNVVKVLEYGDGELSEVYYEGEFYHIENLLNNKGEKNNILLKEPIEIGNSWTTPDGYNRSITGLDVEIKTPMDTFTSLEVTTDLGEGKVQKHYYARDIGLVASIYEEGSNKVETLLKSMINEPLEHNLQIYYPLNSDVKTVYTIESINFYTNQSIEKLLEDLMKNPSYNSLMPILSNSTVINSIKLDRNSWTLRVDFSREFLTDMNAGSSLETEILKSVVNTLGKFYDVENVYISIEGKPYESGHYALKENQFFTVDYEDIEIYK
ncbi:MAG: GerMN domain-containing protein [Tissierellaceae bacterium]|nr:GerMN domain-containing protein [Tissierellaceae bacterium]